MLFSLLRRARKRRSLSNRYLAEALESRVLLTEFVVSAAGDVVDGNFGDGEQTLREAIERANAEPDADTIVFANLPTQIITNATPLSISEDVTIIGLGARELTIAG